VTVTPEPPPATVVDVDYVARRMGINLADISADQRFLIQEAIAEAQGEVEAYLNQPVVPRLYTETERLPYADGWRLTYGPVVQIVSAVPEVYEDDSLTGYFTVTYYAGLNAASDEAYRPIRTEVVDRIFEDPSVQQVWRSVTPADQARRIRSASVEGQSATYDWLTPGGAVEGSRALGAQEDPQKRMERRVGRWRRRSVFQRRGEPYPSSVRPLGFYR
jgi:hypothetical protein